VRVYEAAEPVDIDRRRALDHASGILRAAGLRIVWRPCTAGVDRDVRPGRPDAPKAAACSNPPEAGELILRIARASHGVQGDVMGFSYVPGIVATALADRVADAARRTGVRAELLLGGTIAHEIGHLLLGQTQHPASGLMRSTWSDEELRRSGPSMFRLSRDEARQIVNRLRAGR
jgi:hypothetical protein